MTVKELKELYYITPIANVAYICRHGILSHRRARGVPHTSVAMTSVQEIRSRKTLPGGKPLHDYVNLYICVRNPMMYSLRSRSAPLCVLGVSRDVLYLDGVVVTDRNAASSCLFAPAPDGLEIVDRDLVLAQYWIHEDTFEEWRRKSIKCAEVLVPDHVDPTYITAAYVASEADIPVLSGQLMAASRTLAVIVDADLFFR